MAKRAMIGGSFAPPLTDAALGEIDGLIGKTSPRKQDAAKVLFKAVTHWWELPESGGEGNRAHQGGFGTIVPLDGAIADALYDEIPWGDELEAMRALFADEEASLTANRTMKLEAWRCALADHLWETHVSPLADKRKMLAAIRVYRLHPELEEMLLPSQLDTIKANAEKVDTYFRAYVAAVRNPATAPIPRPDVEPTVLRNGLHTLLWHVKELNLDREPITSDLIKV